MYEVYTAYVRTLLGNSPPLVGPRRQRRPSPVSPPARTQGPVIGDCQRAYDAFVAQCHPFALFMAWVFHYKVDPTSMHNSYFFGFFGFCATVLRIFGSKQGLSRVKKSDLHDSR